ncbi:alpha/beta hydrolase [Parahaliea maris]|uniref:Alpha/beta hydrolase n=1 Tax=Parahaliea maris TaxID=2716870 RepID=A0A5C8ZZX0_9GAMM|nr:alpha/beta hydrolase [Parahaliea maris]TXS94038.1 alpha/beta hydrolase [Parahaliea maris]
MLQRLKALILRQYYRFSSVHAWRGALPTPRYSERQLPLSPPVNIRIYPGERGAEHPLLVYFHGGGWVIGDLASHQPFCQRLCELSGCSVVSVDYRLAPEHPFPAAPADCLAATRWIAGHPDECGPSNGQLVLGGDSAGGNLALCTALALSDAQREILAGLLLIYPVTDHYSAGYDSYRTRATGQVLTANLMRWFWDTYLGPADPAGEAVSTRPLLSPALESLPPSILVTAGKDPLLDEGRALKDRLEQAGVALNYRHYDAEEHGFACSHAPRDAAKDCHTRLADWLSSLAGRA